MRIYIAIVLFLFFFSGCSTKTPPNNWQFKSAKAFQNYTGYFFEDKQILAKSSLDSAVSYAKQSADLDQLAHIYLGVCALKRSVGDNSKCEQFEKTKELAVSKKLDAYYKMLHKQLAIDDIKDLPKEYQDFAAYYILQKHNKLFESIKMMEKVSSKFIAAGLVKEYLKKTEVKYLIDQASFYGYKKVVLFWLEHLLTLEENSNEKDKISKKIKILKEK